MRYSEAEGANAHLPASLFLFLPGCRFRKSHEKCTLHLNLLANWNKPCYSFAAQTDESIEITMD